MVGLESSAATGLNGVVVFFSPEEGQPWTCSLGTTHNQMMQVYASAMGMGLLELVHACVFSIWPTAHDMGIFL